MRLIFLQGFLFTFLILILLNFNVYPQNIEPPVSELQIRIFEDEAFNLARQWNSNSVNEALEKYRRAAESWKKLEKPSNSVANLREVAKLNLWLGNEVEAEKYLLEALEISKNNKLFIEQIKILCDFAHLKMDLGKMSESRSFLDKAKLLVKDSQAPSAQTDYLFNEGEYHFYIYDLKNAVEFYNRALESLEKAEDETLKGKIHISLGYSLAAQSEFDLSLKTLENALSIYKNNGNKRGETLASVAVGATYTMMGEKQKSLEYYRNAEKIFPEELDLIEKASLYNGIAFNLENYGEYQFSIDYRIKAYSFFLREKHLYGQVSTLWSLGKLSILLGKKQESLDYLLTGKDLAENLKDKFYQAIFNEELGNYYLHQSEAEKALIFYRKGLDLLDINYHQRISARIFNKIGEIYFQKKDFQHARKYFTDALELNRFVRDKFAQAENLYRISIIEQSEKNDEKSLDLIKKSIELTENLSSDVINAKLQSNYFSGAFERYELYINILMKLYKQTSDKKYIVEAFQASEKSRARAMLETLNLSNADFTKDSDIETVKLEKEIRSLLNQKSDKLTDLLSQKAEKSEIDILDKEINLLTLELEEIKSKLKQNSPYYSAVKNPEPFNIQDFQEKILDENSVLLEFSLGENESYLWLVGKNEISSYILPPREEIETKVENLRQLIAAQIKKSDESIEDYQARINEAAKNYPAAAKDLSKILFGQVSGKLANQRLIIVPDGKLYHLPFSALPLPDSDSEQPILLTNEIIYEPSASTLALISKGEKQSEKIEKSILVFSDPVFTTKDSRFGNDLQTTEITETKTDDSDKLRFAESLNSLPRLEESKNEGDSILQIAGFSNSDIFTGFDATREKFLNLKVSDYRILHFATHGLIDENRPELSGIIFSAFNEKREKLDQIVRLQDIYGLNLNADLVVLSACETGIGKEVKGEGLLSLNNGFLQTGAKSVLSSLWKVEDAATVELMKEFYQILADEEITTSKALQKAQIKLWNSGRYKSPFYWAAFTIQGDFRRKPDISRGYSHVYSTFAIISAIIFPGAVFVYFFKRRRKS